MTPRTPNSKVKAALRLIQNKENNEGSPAKIQRKDNSDVKFKKVQNLTNRFASAIYDSFNIRKEESEFDA